MLPAKNRLKSINNREFGPLLKGRFLSIKRKQSDLKENRFAVLVSKKYSHKATERNKVKRYIFRFLERNKAYLTKKDKAYDFLIIVLTTGAIKSDNKDIFESDLNKILETINV